MARRGMNDHALRFVDNQQPIVLKYYPERDFLRKGPIRPRSQAGTGIVAG